MNTKSALGVLFLALTTMVVLTGTAAADNDMGEKLERGAANILTGWVELPYQVITQASDDPYRGVTYGFFDGISRGVQRTLYGTWDVVSFPFPPYDKPVMDPETLLSIICPAKSK